jgi:hypothetical protein
LAIFNLPELEVISTSSIGLQGVHMLSIAKRFLSVLLFIGMFSPVFVAAKPGEDYVGSKCSCKKCAENGGDVFGDCENVCKGKETTVSTSGSARRECKKSEKRPNPKKSGAMSTPAGGMKTQ